MATSEASQGPGRFVGRSGRVYELDPSEAVREGSLASVRAARALGSATAESALDEGHICAIKVCLRKDASALAAFELECACFEALGTGAGPRPVPRLVDRIDDPERVGHLIGLVLEWCPVDLELWWASQAAQPDAFRTLCGAMAEVARRAGDARDALAAAGTLEDASPELRPRKLLRGDDGRWVIGAFSRHTGSAPVDPNAAATELMSGTENFCPPEQLFGALIVRAAAQDAWAIGAVFFALLKLRSFLRGAVDLPTTGTESHRFRSHRAALVADLFARKSDLFRGRPIDPRQFLYPDRLPDQDRAAVTEALGGVFGDPQQALEGHLAREVLRMLDRALCIDPERRYARAADMAIDFEQLDRRYRESAAELRAARSGPADDVSTQILTKDLARTLIDAEPDPHMLGDERPTQVSPSPLLGPGVDELPPPTLPSGTAAAAGERDDAPSQASFPPAPRAVPAPTEPVHAQAPRPARPTRSRPPDAPRPRPGVPAWAVAALVVLAGTQALELGLIGLLWWRIEQIGDRQPAATAPLAEASPAAPAPPITTATDAAIDALTGGAVATDLNAAGADAKVLEDAAAGLAPVDPSNGGDAEALGGAAAALAPTTAQAGPAGAPSSATPAGSSRASRSASNASAAGSSAAASPASAQAAAATSGQGVILLSGAKGYLMGPGGRADVGQVAAGAWDVYADLDGSGAKLVGSVALSGGQTAEFKCGFGACKRTR